MRTLLMRHGQTGSNVSGALDTAAPGAVLTELGQRQAAAAVPHLLERGVTAAFSSHLMRAQQTAAPLAEHLGVEIGVHEGLTEIRAGDLEMLNDSASVQTYLQTMLGWLEGNLEARVPGGETGHEFLRRYDEAIAEVQASAQQAGHQSILVVSHGAAMATWVGSRANILAQWPKTGGFGNTGLVVLEGGVEDLTVREWLPDPVGSTALEEPDALS